MILLLITLSFAADNDLCQACKSVRFETHETGWFGMLPKGHVRWVFIEEVEKQEAWIKKMKKRYWKSPFPKTSEDSPALSSNKEDDTTQPAQRRAEASTPDHTVLRSIDGKVCIQQHPSGLLLGTAQDGCSVLESIDFPSPNKTYTQPMLVQQMGCWVIQPKHSRFSGGEVSYRDGLACFTVPPTTITVIEAAGTSSLWLWNDEKGEFLLADENSERP